MKNVVLYIILGLSVIACNNNEKKDTTTNAPEKQEIAKVAYASFGDQIDDKNVITQAQIANTFKNIQPGDSIPVKFNAKVNEVCQSKGCWMKMDMEGDEAMVKFKDYAFFMPKDIADQEIIVEGIAFVKEMSVDEQKHYAEDAGKTEEEIAAITAPKRTLSILSNGVLIPEKQ